MPKIIKNILIVLFFGILLVGFYFSLNIYLIINQKPQKFSQLPIEKQNFYHRMEETLPNLLEGKNYVKGQVVAKFSQKQINLKNKYSFSKLKQNLILQKLDLELNDSFDELNWISLNSDSLSTAEIIEAIYFYPYFEIVEPTYIVSMSANVDKFTPNDISYAAQWNLKKIQMEEAFYLEKNTNLTQSEVIVAVLDTGINYNHSDIKNNLWSSNSCKDPNGNNINSGCLYGINFTDIGAGNYNFNVLDNHGHGSVISSIIAAATNNNNLMAGMSVNNKIKIMSIKVLDNNGEGSVGNIVGGLQFANFNNVKIANLSLALPVDSQILKDAMQTYKMLYITAASNEGSDLNLSHNPDCNEWLAYGPDTTGYICDSNHWCCPIGKICCSNVAYPCEYKFDHLICVGATSSGDNISIISNYGSNYVHVMAPGEDVMGIKSNSATGSILTTGTSVAAPHVTGLAALIWSFKPNLTIAEVKEIILNSGDSLAVLQGKTITGKRINAYEALMLAGMNLQTTPTNTPTPTLTPTFTPTPTPIISAIPTNTPTPSQIADGFCNTSFDCDWICGLCKSKIKDSLDCGSALLPGQSYGLCDCQASISRCVGQIITSVTPTPFNPTITPIPTNCQNPSAYLASLSLPNHQLHFNANKFLYELTSNGNSLPNPSYRTQDSCASVLVLKTTINSKKAMLIIVKAHDGQSSLVYLLKFN